MVTRFQDYWKRLKPKLDDAFMEQLSILLGNAPERNSSPLRSSLEGGKKLRGCLLCMISDALGGVLESAIPRAIAVELIQTATLIHDDFVDQDTTRRNMPAAWTLEGARRAVLLGDVIFADVIEMMNELSREDGLVVAHAIAQVSRGALHEPLDPMMLLGEIQSNKVDGRLYEKIIHLKTGILFGAACQLGAIAAEANDKLKEKSYRYGLRIGEAYQIADDLKEVNHHLATQSIHLDEMAALTPTFFYFVKGMRPYILAILEGKESNLNHDVLEYFRDAGKLMEHEIERRLQSAIAEIEPDFPTNEYNDLVRQAPWDLISMLNES